MKLYLAPMEGITGYTYRNVYRRHFADADRYFTPFIPHHEKLGRRVKDEISPENNMGENLVPQVMIGNAYEMATLERLMGEYGYSEININTGCPSPTVVNKNRGSAILKDPEAMDRLFDEIFKAAGCRLSLKTRLGFSDVSEWERIAGVIGRYPFSEVIIHARVRDEFYNGSAHVEAMEIANELIPVNKCYNGDIFTPEDAEKMQRRFPWLDRIMVGRGVLADPLLIEEIRTALPLDVKSGASEEKTFVPADRRIYDFMDDMLETYLIQFDSEINTLYHLKELWSHLASRYPDKDRELKVIRKTKKLAEYKSAVRQILL